MPPAGVEWDDLHATLPVVLYPACWGEQTAKTRGDLQAAPSIIAGLYSVPRCTTNMNSKPAARTGQPHWGTVALGLRKHARPGPSFAITQRDVHVIRPW